MIPQESFEKLSANTLLQNPNMDTPAIDLDNYIRESMTDERNFTYIFDVAAKTCTATLKSGSTQSTILVPIYYFSDGNLYTVTDFTLAGNTSVKVVYIPDKFTTIPSGCFSGCTNLVNVVLPKTLRKIEASAFSSCSSLNTIELPSSDIEIAGTAFDSNSNINLYKEVYHDITEVNTSFTDYNVFSGGSGKTMTDLISAMSNNSTLISAVSDGATPAKIATNLLPDNNYTLGILEIVKYNKNRCVCRYTALLGNTDTGACKTWFGESQVNAGGTTLIWSSWREVANATDAQTIAGEKTFTDNLQVGTTTVNKNLKVYGTISQSGDAIGQYSSAFGQETIAYGENSHAEGYNTKATGDYSHAEGAYTEDHSLFYYWTGGFQCIADTPLTYAVPDGVRYNDININDYVAYLDSDSPHNILALGKVTAKNYTGLFEITIASISGSWPTTLGNYYWLGFSAYLPCSETKALGMAAHAEGGGTDASADFSHAEGILTKASGICSHAEGSSTVANKKSQHVFGEYNISDSEDNPLSRGNGYGRYVEIVGNGTLLERKNARTLD